MFLTFEEAVAWIENSHRFGEKLDLIRMKIACELLEHPEKTFKSIHVAGTNGKGSTTNFIKNILYQAGYKVGIYTSPYVVKFNERIGIGLDFISDEDIIKYANILQALWNRVYEDYQDSITFFEILTLMCFLYFRDQAIDIAVIEVGLGGLLDATNVIDPVISVITNISYDHMKQLGNTLESIALNKLGIVKPFRPLVTTEDNPQLWPLFEEKTHECHSELIIINPGDITEIKVGTTTEFIYQETRYKLQLTGLHQIKNAVLAIKCIETLKKDKQIEVENRNIIQGLWMTQWPGRFEIFNGNVVLDGAHNIGGIESLKSSIKLVFPAKKIKCLFCMMRDKEHFKVIGELDNLVDEFHFTQISYYRSATAQELYEESTHQNKFTHENPRDAFYHLRDTLKENEVLIVTGSLYFISEIRPLIANKY
jgi:dihydrofolate synthase/folylpolyglutamate synthase